MYVTTEKKGKINPVNHTWEKTQLICSISESEKRPPEKSLSCYRSTDGLVYVLPDSSCSSVNKCQPAHQPLTIFTAAQTCPCPGVLGITRLPSLRWQKKINTGSFRTTGSYMNVRKEDRLCAIKKKQLLKCRWTEWHLPGEPETRLHSDCSPLACRKHDSLKSALGLEIWNSVNKRLKLTIQLRNDLVFKLTFNKDLVTNVKTLD